MSPSPRIACHAMVKSRPWGWVGLGGPLCHVMAVLGAPGDFDQLFVAWPQVVDLTGIKNWVDEGVRLGMYYHTFNPQTFGFEIGLATSTNGRQWTKRGPVKLVRGEKGTFRYMITTLVLSALACAADRLLFIVHVWFPAVGGVPSEGTWATLLDV